MTKSFYLNNRKHFELEDNINYEISDCCSTSSEYFHANIWGEFRPFMKKYETKWMT